MADSGENTPIIIKKGKRKGEGHHGGAWKVAYADFVTAMMALFIVLWILGQSEEVKEAVAGYFKDPVGFGTGRGPTVIDGGGMTKVSPEIMSDLQLQEMERKKLEQMGEELLDELSSGSDFEGILDQVEIEIIDEGLRIEIMESSEDVFFEVGTAQMNNRAEQLVKLIGKEISKLNNKIVIEGHTDSRPFPGAENGGYSNYELSADRANAARRSLINGGVKQEQIDEIRGYADNRLRNKNNPYDVVNRRISIIVKYTNPL